MARAPFLGCIAFSIAAAITGTSSRSARFGVPAGSYPSCSAKGLQIRFRYRFCPQNSVNFTNPFDIVIQTRCQIKSSDCLPLLPLALTRPRSPTTRPSLGLLGSPHLETFRESRCHSNHVPGAAVQMLQPTSSCPTCLGARDGRQTHIKRRRRPSWKP